MEIKKINNGYSLIVNGCAIRVVDKNVYAVVTENGDPGKGTLWSDESFIKDFVYREEGKIISATRRPHVYYASVDSYVPYSGTVKGKSK